MSVLLILVSTGASPRCEVYATVAASDAWISRTKELPLRRQVIALRQRLACDARVRGQLPDVAVCVSCLTAEGRRAYQAAQEKRQLAEAADTRPPGIVLFYLLDGKPVAPADTAQWQPVVTQQLVRQLSFLESSQAASMGGSRARDGMVSITTKKQP